MQYRDGVMVGMQRLGKSFVPVYETGVSAYTLGSSRRRLSARLNRALLKGRGMGMDQELDDAMAEFMLPLDKHMIEELTDSELDELSDILEDIIEKKQEESELREKVYTLAGEGNLLLENLKMVIDVLPERLEEQKGWIHKIGRYLVAVNMLCSRTVFEDMCAATGLPCPIVILQGVLGWLKRGCRGKRPRLSSRF